MKGESERKASGAVIAKRKLGKKAIALIAVCTALVLMLSIVLPVVLWPRSASGFEIPAVNLPTEEKFALNTYKYEDLSDVQSTLRADTMRVTERGIARPQVNYLSDTYTLTCGSYSKSIEFVEYPWPGHAGGGDGSIAFFENAYAAQAYAEFGLDPATATAEELAEARKQYAYFYKYMLLSQGYNEVQRMQALSREGRLTQADLFKHPAADMQYGAVEGTDNAVEKQITLDPLYRSYHATGLYLPAGEAVTVKVSGLKSGERISMFIGLNDTLAWRGNSTGDLAKQLLTEAGAPYYSNNNAYFFTNADNLTAIGQFFKFGKTGGHDFIQSQYNRQSNRLPWLSAEFVFDHDGEYTIGTPFGGIMHIDPKNCYSSVKTTIRGAVETPHYILGVTTPEYFDTYLRNAPGVYGVIDTENGQLIGAARYMRDIKTEEIDKLAMLWHSFFSVNESFTGGTYNRNNLVKFDQHVPAGAAVALGGYVYACPTGWFADVCNYRGLLTRGTWGILHEVGHNHGSSYGTVWGFGGAQEGEVRNNALITLSYLMFCDIGTTINANGDIGAEHGFVAHGYSSLKQTLAIKASEIDDFDSYGYFAALSMYSNIMHSFGAEKFYELLYTYKAVPSYNWQKQDANGQTVTVGNKRSDFAYRCSLVFGMDFRTYFNELYSANIGDELFSEEQLAEMNALPKYEPVACLYAGGIDGVKTGGDHKVVFGEPVDFDLKGKTLVRGGVGFEIISVSQPEHGKIADLGDGKYRYTFDNNYAGTFDSFRFRVKLSDGVIHEFTVSLRISYNGARISEYKNIASRNSDANALWAATQAEIADMTPAMFGVVSSGIPAYTTEKNAFDVRVAEYYWKAPESGEVELGIKCDDRALVYFGDTFDTAECILQVNSHLANYNDNFTKTVSVEKDKYYAVKIVNLNTGGGGSAALGIRGDDGKIADIPATQVYYPSFNLEKEAPTYVYEPEYIVSKKDNIKISTTGTDKGDWTVVKAPENIQDGRFVKEDMFDPDTHQYIGTLTTDKWDWLIDGLSGTMLHTTWHGAGVKPPTAVNPDEFIIDTGNIQQFNYFSITTRNSANALIRSYELLISDDNITYTQISAGEELNKLYKGGVAQLTFPQTTGRYWKLLVKSTTGGNFTIVSELDAGIRSSTQKIVPPTSDKLFLTGGWVNSATLDAEPSGYIIANNAGEKMVIRFRGESLALYGATGEGYGTADIYVDGVRTEQVDFGSEIAEARKLVFNIENLEEKEHTVEVITTSSEKVMMNILGVSYSAEMLNAPNIYLERALTVSLVVFVILFVLAITFLLLLVFLPDFRKAVFGNRVMNALDNRKGKERASGKAKTEKNVPAKAEKFDEEPKTSAEEKSETKARLAPVQEKKSEVKAESKQKPAEMKSAEPKKPAEAKKAPVQKTTADKKEAATKKPETKKSASQQKPKSK